MLVRVRVVDEETDLYEAEGGGRGPTIKRFVYHDEEFKYCAERKRHALEISVRERT